MTLRRPSRRGRRGRGRRRARSGRLRADGAPTLGEIAVLFRINAQSEAFEEALAARGIPYVVRGAARFFDRPEVREAVTRIRGAARSGEAATRAVRPETVRATLAGMGWTPEAPAARGQTRDRWESLQALMDQARGVLRRRPHARRVRRRPRPPRRRAARARRRRRHPGHLHAAKGLEWDAVFLCGLQDGTLPITYAETPGRRSRRSAGCSTSA